MMQAYHTVYNGEKAKLLEEFSKLESNAERMAFVDSKFDRSAYPNADNPSTKIDMMEVKKSNDQAKKFRLKGNEYFTNRKLVKALELYNQSICFAEVNSEALGMGYANRSAIYFEWGKHDLCLANINLARNNRYPQNLMDKLNKRKSKCLIALQKSHNDVDDNADQDNDDDKPLTPTLSFPPHPKVPFIAECLELCENEEFGRHIITKVDLSVGQVVAIEDSFCAVLDQKLKYERCTNCLRENYFNLIPCKCCTAAMFCDEKCASEAEQSFHRIECPIINFLSTHGDDLHYNVIRTTICAVTSFGDMDAFHTFIEEPDKGKINAFTLNYRDDMPSSETYKAILALKTNQDKRTDSELFDIATMSSTIFQILIQRTPLSELLQTAADKVLLMELIFHHYQIAATNAIKLGQFCTKPEDCGYGDGFYAFNALINHSCAPNTVTVCCGRRSAIFIKRPVKVGGQLFDNYGIDHDKYGLAIRQEKLWTDFKFKCQCEACQNDYPGTFDYVRRDNVPGMLNIIDQYNILMRPNRSYIRKNIARYAKYIDKYDKHYPCLQLSGAVGCLLACLIVLYNEISVRNFKIKRSM